MESFKKYWVNEKEKKRKKETKNRGKIENKWWDNGFKPIINYHIKCEWSKDHKKRQRSLDLGW